MIDQCWRYELVAEDYVQLYLFRHSQDDRVRKRVRQAQIIYSGLSLVIAVLFFLSDKVLESVFLAVLSVLVFFYFPRRMQQRYVKHYQSFANRELANHLGRPIELRLTPDTIITRDEEGELKINKTHVTELVELPEQLVISLFSGNKIVIPTKRMEGYDALKQALQTMPVPFRDERTWKFSR